MIKHAEKILILIKYPENTSPSQRFRFELYKESLLSNGFEVTVSTFFNKKDHRIIYQQGLILRKFTAVVKGLFYRFIQLFTIHQFDYIFIQKEAVPLGPPFFEWVYTKVFKKKLIYDIDDAIWISKTSEHNNIALIFKNAQRVSSICKWSYKVSCGNYFLCSYAEKYNQNVVYNPTCVDTERKHNILCDHDVDRITIGWTGSFSTLGYLDLVIPVLQRLQRQYDFDVKIICNKKPSFNIKNLYYVEWSEANEVSELAKCQIGIMPLTNDDWSKGKCGFKLIQYLSLQIPAVSSPVGVNNSIIDDGYNGFLCSTDEEWFNCLEKLILDTSLRKKLGVEGRKKIVAKYSLAANKENFLGLFK